MLACYNKKLYKIIFGIDCLFVYHSLLVFTDLQTHSNDVLHEDRAVGDPFEADKCNFLHPVVYYYSKPPQQGICIKAVSIECTHHNIYTNVDVVHTHTILSLVSVFHFTDEHEGWENGELPEPDLNLHIVEDFFTDW